MKIKLESHPQHSLIRLPGLSEGQIAEIIASPESRDEGALILCCRIGDTKYAIEIGTGRRWSTHLHGAIRARVLTPGEKIIIGE